MYVEKIFSPSYLAYLRSRGVNIEKLIFEKLNKSKIRLYYVLIASLFGIYFSTQNTTKERHT